MRHPQSSAPAQHQRLIVVGDSHLDAAKQASKTWPLAARTDFIRIAKPKGGHTIGDASLDDIVKAVGGLAERDLVVSMIGGNQHQTFGLVQHAVQFDLYIPHRESEVVDGAQIIPYRILYELFKSGVGGRDGHNIVSIRNAARCRMVHIAPPPPKEDEKHILRRHETWFQKAGLAERGITNSSVRLRLWHLQQAVTQELCKEWDVTYIPPPLGTADAAGFLARDYYASDATHANAAYGTLVLKQVEDIAAKASLGAAA